MEWTRGRLLILAGTIIPLGFLITFVGFGLYFDHREPWMRALMTMGLLTIPGGVVVKIMVARWMGKNRMMTPWWYYIDVVVVATLAVLLLIAFITSLFAG